MIKKKKLINFVIEIAEFFNKARIRAPLQLQGNNEDILIKFFKKIIKRDWIFCSWRSNYQCLSKDVLIKILKNKILKWKSISLCFPKYNIYSSAILGGSIPIALGVVCTVKKKIKSKSLLF